MNKFKFWDLFFFCLSILATMVSAMGINKEINNNTPDQVLFNVLCGLFSLSLLLTLSKINDQIK